MPKISVIIPVYNVEKYLPECIDSILAQDFEDFECLMVDDGSTDGSAALCDSYVSKDSRFKVFHQPNQGVSAARNRGISEAKGEWIYFIDGDDWMMPGIFRELSYVGDVMVGCYSRAIGVSQTYTISHQTNNAVNAALSYLKEELRTCVGGFMIKKISFPDILFSESYKYGEDMELLLKCLLRAKKTVVDSRPWVTYRMNPTSAMSKPTLRRYDVFFSRLELIEYAKECGNLEVSSYLENIGCADSLLTVSKAIVREGGRITDMVSFVKNNRVVCEFLDLSIGHRKDVPTYIKNDLIKLRNSPLRFGISVMISKINYEIRSRLGRIKLKILGVLR